ncbi:MAG: UvrB/UvrC motif-containing protein [Verrucomicrobia bacterium]|nr:UvrB/UvrC motif-containing protein [Verrucomicrobiota bacterium]
MSFDISHILESWDYKPGEVMVRRFRDKAGVEKIQLRVDLGLLQMNASGRPDGKRPSGYASLLDCFQAKLKQHTAENDDSDAGFQLTEEDCSRMQLEVLQYHHRYLCLLQLQDFDGAARDAKHNLALFELAERYAESDELAWSLKQFQPHVLMVLARARASQALASSNYDLAIMRVEEGLSRLRHFYRSHARPEMEEQSGEIRSLEVWLEKIRSDRPLTSRELLEKALDEAVQREDYERAAEMRDALKNLTSEG